ncbi:hypothetical protein NEMIN01_0298 [Nematocida minor]|uniref:uncharacterized protein n=1 Tax=Nematocida minor TaxID=1912983 RepID=UPI00221F426C|nr:uncharacterized protein NEMIN01_0298 [Nematocida minor]KAI5189132.1 hypothetical protein NEMIN01_0298 [Nematocida minor]
MDEKKIEQNDSALTNKEIYVQTVDNEYERFIDPKLDEQEQSRVEESHNNGYEGDAEKPEHSSIEEITRTSAEEPIIHEPAGMNSFPSIKDMFGAPVGKSTNPTSYTFFDEEGTGGNKMDTIIESDEEQENPNSEGIARTFAEEPVTDGIPTGIHSSPSKEEMFDTLVGKSTDSIFYNLFNEEGTGDNGMHTVIGSNEEQKHSNSEGISRNWGEEPVTHVIPTGEYSLPQTRQMIGTPVSELTGSTDSIFNNGETGGNEMHTTIENIGENHHSDQEGRDESHKSEESEFGKIKEAFKSFSNMQKYLRSKAHEHSVAIERFCIISPIIFFVIGIFMSFYGRLSLCLLGLSLVGLHRMIAENPSLETTVGLSLLVLLLYVLLLIWPITSVILGLIYLFMSLKAILNSWKSKDYSGATSSILGFYFTVILCFSKHWINLVEPNMIFALGLPYMIFMAIFFNIRFVQPVYRFFEGFFYIFLGEKEDDIPMAEISNSSYEVIRSLSKYWFYILLAVSVVAGIGTMFVASYVNSQMTLTTYLSTLIHSAKSNTV